MADQCLAVPKNTLKRCRNKAKGVTPYCGTHGRLLKKTGFTQVRHYDGSIVQYENGLFDLSRVVKKEIIYWQDINDYIDRIPKVDRENAEEMARILRVGSNIDVTIKFLSEEIFPNKNSLLQFYFGEYGKTESIRLGDNYYRLFNGEILEKARNFLGICYNLKLNKQSLLVKLQAKIRGKLYRKKTGITKDYIHLRVKHKEDIDKIVKIQKWFRYWSWLKKLPVKPKMMVSHYIPNLEKIKFLQTHLREYIHKKIRHSHGCPYSGEDYWMIPKETRIVYKYEEGSATHWRYYDALWLHEDFLHQTSNKRFVVEPSTKMEFPEEFVVKVAKKVWRVTREQKMMMNQEGDMIEGKYYVERDWNNFFSRRSVYCFSLMLFDLLRYLGIDLKNIDPLAWRKPEMRVRYQHYFLDIGPTLYSIAQNLGHIDFCYTIQYRCGDILSQYMIFPDEDNIDVLSGLAIYTIHFFLTQALQEAPAQFGIFHSTITENFKECFADMI